MAAIHKYGSEEQKNTWLPKMAAGEAIGCFGLTEPDSGSDPGAMRTRARKDGTDWVINGTKTWITNGSVADAAVVWAATDDGIRGFLVPTDAPGFSTNVIDKKLSLRASITSELVLEDVRLPAETLLPGAKGLGAPLSCLNEARYGIVWGAAGAAQACYESALEYALSREPFGRPIGGFQLTQRKLADMVVDVNHSRSRDLRLPAETLLPGAKGLGAPLSCLNEARYGIVWGAAGAAQACYESALEYALSREQFGRPIGGFQLTQRKLADMVVDVNHARIAALRLGRLKDERKCNHDHVSFGKVAKIAAAQRGDAN